MEKGQSRICHCLISRSILMNRFISFKFSNNHALCSQCLVDCFQDTFFLKNCGHSYCKNCVHIYYDEISKNIASECIFCISKGTAIPLWTEEVDRK